MEEHYTVVSLLVDSNCFVVQQCNYSNSDIMCVYIYQQYLINAHHTISLLVLHCYGSVALATPMY